MPKALERQLRRQAKKKGFTGERADAYVYGTLRKTGWTPSHQQSSKTESQKKKLYRKKK